MKANKKHEQLLREALRLRQRLADAETAVILARAAVARLELDLAAARQADRVRPFNDKETP